MSNFMKITAVAAVLGAASAIGSPASAEKLIAYATRHGNANAATTHVFVPLDDTGNTSHNFTTDADNALVKITYNAECGVVPVGWLAVTILVDNQQANPASGDLFALCTGSNNYNLTGAVRQSLIKVPAQGNHFVQVLVDRKGGSTNWWLGDSSIVVEQK
jgi:hypothetical protein